MNAVMTDPLWTADGNETQKAVKTRITGQLIRAGLEAEVLKNLKTEDALE
jgi:hypothetical protein